MKKEKRSGNDNGFAVRCNSWFLYCAFAEELKAIGYTHNSDFNAWDRETCASRDCVWVSDTWNSRYAGPKYSFSRTEDEVFDLETEWTDAVDHENGIVEVGCQKISFDKVNQLYKLINKI